MTMVWRALVELAVSVKTQAYIAKRTAEGKTPREARRCLKRYIARHLYRLLENPPHHNTPRNPPVRT